MKLHELLAVETNLENQARKCQTDLAATFEKKRHLFEEKRIVFSPFAENEKPVTEAQSDIQTTIPKELAWLQGHLAKSLDASFQVACTNTHAKADIVLEDDGGTVLAKDVPATSLLELEKRIQELTTLLNAIPTLDPAKGFQADPQRGDAVYKARDVNKSRTKKQVRPIVKYEATKEHPAQVDLINEDLPIGTIQEQEWSGLISPSQKSDLLARAETVARAVRRARARANDATVDSSRKLGVPLLKYILY